MTLTAILLVVAGVLAVGDWTAVARHLRRIEFVLKPATLGVLIAVAVLAHLDADVRPWLIAALALGLVGDVALMRSAGDEPDGWFLGGLGAFLLGHACYVIAFLQYGVGWKYAVSGVLVAVGIAGLALPAVLRGAARTGGRELAVVVAVYATLLGAMAALAVGTGAIATAIGGVVFLGSDTLLARERFVGPLFRRAPIEPAVTAAAAEEPAKPDRAPRPSPDAPARPSPDAPARPSPDAPARPSPEAPAYPSPDAPARPSPDAPARPSPGRPIRRTPFPVGDVLVIVSYHAAQALILIGLLERF